MAESGFARQVRKAKAQRAATGAAVRGLPAVMIVVAAAISLTVAFRAQQSGQLYVWYLTQARQAVDVDDWEAGEVLSRKLVELRPGDDRGRYLLAICVEAAGDVSRAERLMQEVAPEDSPGHDLAHWWIVRHLISSSPDGLTSDGLQSLRAHLRQFLRLHDRHAEARMLLGQTELALGNIDAGLEEMAAAADAHPRLRMTVARVAARLGRRKVARPLAEMSVRQLRQGISEVPNDIDRRLELADALVMLGDFQSAAEILVEGLKWEDSPRLRLALARVAVSTFDVLAQGKQRSAPALERQLVLLERTLPLAPSYPPLLKRLAELSIDPADTKHCADQMLQPYLEEGTAPAVVYMVLGNHALGQQNYDAARQYLEAAHARQPDFAPCLNNLAWALMHGSGTELPRALVLAEQAITLRPDRTEYRETRGQILARLDRFAEAIPELESGLGGDAPSRITHAVLADAYEAVGQTELAAHHRELE